MGTYRTIVDGLRDYAERLGGKADLMRFLNAKRPTLYRAVNDENPCLPNPEVLCEWLDKMKAQIVFPGEQMAGFDLIPRVKAVAGAGQSFILDGDVEKTYAFRHSFFEYLGVKPKDAVMMFVTGDSMEPVIHDRDTILIDLTDTKIKEGYIYVIALGDTLMVKRMRRIKDGWNICSENENYSPIPVRDQELDSLEVKGRVRWFGRVL